VKKFLPALVLILVTAAAAAFIYKGKIQATLSGEVAENKDAAGRDQGRRGRWGTGGDRAVSILAETAKKADVPVYLYGVGTVQAYNAATVRAQVSGRLISVEFTEGQPVRKGDILARIDPVSYQAAYDQAAAKKAINEAVLENARADLKRLEQLEKSNYTSTQQADAQRAKVAQAEAQLRQDQAVINSAKTDLDHTVIRAPIDGRTGLREIDTGNLVTPNDASGIVVVAQLQPISVFFTLPETYIADLIDARKAGTVKLTASAGGKVLGEGELAVIDNRIDQNTGTVRLKGTFPNEDLRLWPGQFVSVRLHLKTLEDATVIPSAALQQGASGRFVYRVEPDSTVKLTPVEVASEDENQAVIASGIEPGEVVAVSGFANIQDGAKIKVDDGRRQDEKPGRENRGKLQGVSGASKGQAAPESAIQPMGEANAAPRDARPAQ
jgi:multidrug efflux system membrane fusion protein